MREIMFSMFENQEYFSEYYHMHHETINFKAFFRPNQISIELFGSINTQQSNNDHSSSDHEI
jgi:hypothetical protein